MGGWDETLVLLKLKNDCLLTVSERGAPTSDLLKPVLLDDNNFREDLFFVELCNELFESLKLDPELKARLGELVLVGFFFKLDSALCTTGERSAVTDVSELFALDECSLESELVLKSFWERALFSSLFLLDDPDCLESSVDSLMEDALVNTTLAANNQSKRFESRS